MPKLPTRTPCQFSTLHPDAKPRQVTPEDFMDVAQQMARAFYDDPCFSAFWPESSRKGQLMTWWFYIHVKYHHYRNQNPMYYLAPGGATAMFLTHKTWQESTSTLLLLFPVNMWLCGWSISTYKEYSKMHHEMQQLHPTTPHWYLAMLGVDPAYQRQGLGRVVMEDPMRECDEKKMEMYLESSNPVNISFYQRLGFVQCAEPVKGRSAILTSMLRKPNSGRNQDKSGSSGSNTSMGSSSSSSNSSNMGMGTSQRKTSSADGATQGSGIVASSGSYGVEK